MMNKTFTSMNHFFSEDEAGKRQCPVCGKMFNPAPEHAYYTGKNRKDYCCSYTCMRSWEKHKKVLPVKKKLKRGTPVRIAETGETFASIKKCAEHLGVDYSAAYKSLMSGHACRGYHLEAVEEGDSK